MQKTLGSEDHRALVQLIIEKRKAAGITQEELAFALGEHQSFVARLESGQRRIDVIEYVTISRVIGFDAAEALKKIMNNFS